MLYDEKEFTLASGKKLQLRSATENDAAELVQYLTTVCSETNFLAKYADEVNQSVENEINFINFTEESENAILLVSVIDEKIVGVCNITPNKKRRKQHTATIGISVLSYFWGMGIGSLMMNELCEIASEWGLEQLHLEVLEENDRAIQLYTKFGFEKCGCIPNADKYDDGTYASLVLMYKNI